MATDKRFTYRRPPAEYKAPALVVVHDADGPFGMLNRTRDGYALRDLDGKLIDETYGVSRETSASRLRDLVRAGEGPKRHVTCDECGGRHVAEYDHEGSHGEGPIYAVVCDVDNPEYLIDYYTGERAAFDALEG